MKKSIIFALAVLSTSSIYAAPNDATAPAANTAAPQSNQVSQQSPAVNKESDAESLAYLMVIDKSEVAAAKVALKKDVDSKTKDFAKHMVKAHSGHLKDTIALSHKLHIKPEKSEAVESLKEKNKDGLADLKNMKGKEFEVAYANAMVKGHTDALNLLNDKLIPQASNPAIKQYLEATSKVVQEHLDMAKALQNSMTTAANQ